MGKTAFETSDPLRKQAWDEKMFREALLATYWNKFAGSSPESAVFEKTDLEKEQGDKITFGLLKNLTGDGITGSSGKQLEGNEEDLKASNYSLELEQYRHGTRDRGALDRKRILFSIDTEAKTAIKNWETQKIDALHFDAILASPTMIIYPNASAAFAKTPTAATAKAAMHGTNGLLTPSFITKARVWATNGGNGSCEPLKPIKVDGDEFLVMLVSPDHLANLKTDTTFAGWMKDAQNRGKDNPLFKNAVAIVDGVVIHEHRNMPVYKDGGGASVAWGPGVLFGQQALVRAWGKRPEVKSENFDYTNEHGYAVDMILKVGKPVFDSKDFGSVGVYLARTSISDIAAS